MRPWYKWTGIFLYSLFAESNNLRCFIHVECISKAFAGKAWCTIFWWYTFCLRSVVSCERCVLWGSIFPQMPPLKSWPLWHDNFGHETSIKLHEKWQLCSKGYGELCRLWKPSVDSISKTSSTRSSKSKSQTL